MDEATLSVTSIRAGLNLLGALNATIFGGFSYTVGHVQRKCVCLMCKKCMLLIYVQKLLQK